MELVVDRRTLLEPLHATLSVRQQCALLNIHRSGVYYKSPVAQMDEVKLELMRVVDEVYTQYPFFGTLKMASYLRTKGFAVEREQIRGIYNCLGLRSLSPGPHTSKPHPEHKVYPYLLRGVEVSAVDQVWSTDITYIRLRRGFVYLMAIIDWYSRYVLDWELSISLDADFCVETLGRVLENGQCDIFNTDQGAQFTSTRFTELLLSHEIKISMDGKGRALDNIFVERLWRSVKYECVYRQEWETIKDVRQGLKDYFEFYNHVRPHQGLGCDRIPAMVYAGKQNEVLYLKLTKKWS